MVLKWAHFRNHPRYEAARHAEEALLIDIAQRSRALAGPLLKSLHIWEPEFRIHGAMRGVAPELKALLEHIAQPLCLHVADGLLARFRRPDGIRGLYGKGSHNAEKYVLFHPDSPLWNEESKQQLRDIAAYAHDDTAVHTNFVEFIGMLQYGLTEGFFPPTREDLTRFASNREIVGLAWQSCDGSAAATTRPWLLEERS